jgi:hypothetical protein
VTTIVRRILTLTRDTRQHSAVRISGLPDGDLAAASFTSTRTGWAVVGTGRCAHFKSDCTQTSALYATADSGDPESHRQHRRLALPDHKLGSVTALQAKTAGVPAGGPLMRHPLL